MAGNRRLEPEAEAEIDLTPMLDVVFILLIFFIVTATFVKTPGALVQKIDTRTSASIKSPIIVALDAEDSIWIDRKKVSEREIYAVMQDMIEDNPGATSMIQVDASSSFGALRRLQENMMNAGIRKIDISTQQKE